MLAPPGEPQVAAESWNQNHPVCPKCGKPARPAILMFCDSHWVEPTKRNLSHCWRRAAANYLGEFPEKKALIIELGCGLRVPTIR